MSILKPKKTFGVLGAAAVVAFGLSACDDDGETIVVEDGSAFVRVVHASPDAPAVDIYANGGSTPLITDLEYGESSPYLEVVEGSYDFQIRAAGSSSMSAPAFETGPLALSDGSRVTAVAAGLLGSSNQTDAFRVLPLVEDFEMPAAGNAIVRIVHASADAPTVAIDVGNDGTPEIENFGRFADTGMTGVELPAGEPLQIGIWAGEPLGRVTAFTTPALPEGAEIFVVATGLLGELPREADGFSLLAVGPAGSIGFIQQNPTVFALHGSPDAPGVDIFAGDAMLVENLSFGELSSAIQVPPGMYDLDFYAAGTGPGTPAASAKTPALEAGHRYLAIAGGFLAGEDADTSFQLLPVVDELAVDANNARIGVIHASPDAPAVDISTVSGSMLDTPLLVGGLEFPDSVGGAGLMVPPANLTIGIAASGSRSPVATFDIATSAGLRAFAVAAGALAPGEMEEPFRLILVITSEWPWMAAEVLPNTM